MSLIVPPIAPERRGIFESNLVKNGGTIPEVNSFGQVPTASEWRNLASFDAIRDDETEAALDANDEALAEAWRWMRDLPGGRGLMVSGIYFFRKARWDGADLDVGVARTVDVFLEGVGNAVLIVRGEVGANGGLGPANDGVLEESFFIGCSDSVNSTKLLRKVKISNLSLRTQRKAVDENATLRRSGWKFFNIQELFMDYVYTAQFRGEGIVWDGSMDAYIDNSQVAYCSDSVAENDDQRKNHWAVLFETSSNTNPNAGHIKGLHIEYSELQIKFRGSSRHFALTDTKIEVNRTNWSPISGIRVEDGTKEVAFLGGYVIHDLWDEVNLPAVGATPGYKQAHPAAVYTARTLWDSDKAQTEVKWTNVYFTTPDGTAAKWYYGDNSGYYHCSFSRTVCDDALAPFDLGHNNTFDHCTIIMADDLPDNLPAQATINGNVFRIRGNNNRITHNTVYYNGVRPGIFARIEASATKDNVIEGNTFTDVTYGATLVAGVPTSPLVGLPNGETKCGARVRIGRHLADNDVTLAAPTPNVAGRYGVSLAAGTYTGLTFGSRGQRVLVTCVGVVTFEGNANIRTPHGTSITYPAGTRIALEMGTDDVWNVGETRRASTFRTITANTTLSGEDYDSTILANCTAGAITLTFPSDGRLPVGARVRIIKQGDNALTIAGAINNSVETYTMVRPWSSAVFTSWALNTWNGQGEFGHRVKYLTTTDYALTAADSGLLMIGQGAARRTLNLTSGVGLPGDTATLIRGSGAGACVLYAPAGVTVAKPDGTTVTNGDVVALNVGGRAVATNIGANLWAVAISNS